MSNQETCSVTIAIGVNQSDIVHNVSLFSLPLIAVMHDYFCYIMPLIYTPDREYVHIFHENMEIDFPRLPVKRKNATLLFLLSTLPPLSFLLPPLIIIISLFSILMIFHIIIYL